MLLLLLLPSVLSQGVTTPASPTFPFEDIEDPNAQCVDILCYEPIMWSDDKKEVCRFRKEKTCKPVSKEVLDKNLTYLEILPLVHGAGVHYGARDCVRSRRLHRLQMGQETGVGQERHGNPLLLLVLIITSIVIL